MPIWTKVRATFSEADRSAFCDPRGLIDRQFGFPPAHAGRVFSSSMNLDRCSIVHGPDKKFRWNNFGNALAVRHIKAEDPEAWVWDERYHFSRDPMRDPLMAAAQEAFLNLLGDERLTAIQSRARAAGLTPRVHAKGRPDVATFSPSREPQWRFVEVKIAGGQDRLNEDQVRWLTVLAEVLGAGSAVELEFVQVK